MAGFRALVQEEKDGKVVSRVQTVGEDRLPEGDVTVAVTHSTLNYKDGLILAGAARLVRKYPHVPGIDLAGTVERSASPLFKPGDQVVLTGWFLGERYWGGYAEKARVKAEHLLKLPPGLTPARAMAFGTAGFTAMLAICALERHGLTPGAGEVLVTGAGGGVGGVAVAALASLGYAVTASTGRAELHDYLRRLGAGAIVGRGEIANPDARPLLSERWAGCVENVGGTTLSAVIAALKHNASVAVCGNAGGNELAVNALPFMLRGINVLGVNSGHVPNDRRPTEWARLVAHVKPELIDEMTTTIGLDQVVDYGQRILKGLIKGRVVVDVRR